MKQGEVEISGKELRKLITPLEDFFNEDASAEIT